MYYHDIVKANAAIDSLRAELAEAQRLAADRLLEIEAADRANYKSHANAKEWEADAAKAEAALLVVRGELEQALKRFDEVRGLALANRERYMIAERRVKELEDQRRP